MYLSIRRCACFSAFSIVNCLYLLLYLFGIQIKYASPEIQIHMKKKIDDRGVLGKVSSKGKHIVESDTQGLHDRTNICEDVC